MFNSFVQNKNEMRYIKKYTGNKILARSLDLI
jgi:hypothetical protein